MQRKIGISTLRLMTATRLRQINQGEIVHIIQHYNEPVAVLIPYAYYLKLQETAKKAREKMIEEGLK